MTMSEQDRIKLVGGPGKDFPCKWTTTVECRFWECQQARRCKYEPACNVCEGSGYIVWIDGIPCAPVDKTDIADWHNSAPCPACRPLGEEGSKEG